MAVHACVCTCMAVALRPSQFEPECNQSEDESKGPRRDPPDDNEGGTEATVGQWEGFMWKLCCHGY